MPKFKLTIEYDGGPFVGWQRQSNGPSVQEALEKAVERFCGEQVRIKGAGRTDAGVHALGQVAELDLERATDADEVRDAINFHLKPDPIAVLFAESVSDDFSARFDARERHYLYRFIDRRPPLTVLKGRAWHVPKKLDATAMDEAAQALVGQHDFTTFRTSVCQARSPIKTINEISLTRGGDEISMVVRAPSFLHSQVRSFAGTLKLVGEGKWHQSDVAKVLEAKDRSACGAIAPPHGLYLVQVDY